MVEEAPAEASVLLPADPVSTDGSGIEWFRGLERHGGWASADLDDLLAADGADVTQSARKQDRYEVILGQDRYVVPVQAPASGKPQ